MVSTRSGDHHEEPEAGDKRAAADSAAPTSARTNKRHKVEKVVSRPKDEEEGPASTSEGGEPKESSKNGRQDGGKEGDEGKDNEAKSAPSEQVEPVKKQSDDSDGAKDAEEHKGDEAQHKAGQGETLSHMPPVDAERKHGILEKGYCYFVFRPKVETEHPQSLDDVSKFHMILSPEGESLHRLVVIGKKALPDASQSSRPIWGQVSSVADDLKQFKKGLGAYTYETKTRGTRHQPGARVAAAGAYVLHTTEHPPERSSNASAVYHTHLAYEIAVPHEIGEVQKGLHIEHEGVFTLQVKDPDAPSSNPVVGNQPASKHPQFPPDLKGLFKTKFIPANPPALLNYPGAELLLVPSKHTAAQDIGEAAEKELDKEEKELEEELGQAGKGGNVDAKKVLKEIGMDGLAGIEALQGHWE